jgi:hypothetical protein
VLVVLVLVVLGPALLGGRILTTGGAIALTPPFAAAGASHRVPPVHDTDDFYTFQPELLKTRHELESGQLGLWTGDAGAGRPLLASQQQAPLFPLTWLAFLLPFWSSLAWMAAGRLLIAAAGTYRYCRELGHGRGPALLGGVSFAFGTFMVTWLTHPHANVYALLPWLFLLVRRVVRHPGPGAAIGLTAVVGLAALGGHPESFAIEMGVGATYAAFELARARGGRQVPTGWLAAALGVGLCLGAVMLVPLAEMLGIATSGTRGEPPVPRFASFPFAFPELAGRPDKAFSGGGVVNFQERTAYFGVLPMLLAIGTLIVRRRATELFLAGLAVLCLLVQFDTPLARLVRDLPGGDVINLRLFIVIAFAGSVLAASGLEKALRGGEAARRRLLRAMALIGAVIFVGGLIVAVVRDRGQGLSHVWPALQQLPAVHPSETDKGVIALGAVWRWGLLAAVSVAGLWWGLRRGVSRGLLAGLAVAVVAFDLVAMDHGYRSMPPRSLALPPDPPALRWARDHAAGGRVVGQTPVLEPDLPSRFGLRSPGAADLPEPRRYGNLVNALVLRKYTRTRFDVAEPGSRLLAALFGVKLVMFAPEAPVPPWLKVVHDDASARVALNPAAAPRAWVAYDWRPAAGRLDALAQTLRSSPRQVVGQPVIEGAGAADGPGGTGPAAVIRDSDEEVTVRAAAKRAGYLVLDDSVFPGWEAAVDGRPAPIRAANENFRAVAFPAGPHTVTFRYRPASVLTAAVVSGVAFLLLVLGGIYFAVRRRRSGAAASRS